MDERIPRERTRLNALTRVTAGVAELSKRSGEVAAAVSNLHEEAVLWRLSALSEGRIAHVAESVRHVEQWLAWATAELALIARQELGQSELARSPSDRSGSS